MCVLKGVTQYPMSRAQVLHSLKTRYFIIAMEVPNRLRIGELGYLSAEIEEIFGGFEEPLVFKAIKEKMTRMRELIDAIALTNQTLPPEQQDKLNACQFKLATFQKTLDKH